MGSESQHRPSGVRQANGSWCVATTAAHKLPGVANGTDHAVIAARHDVTVMVQKSIGNARQPGLCFSGVAHDGLAARVGAGHHQHQALWLGQPGAARRAPGGFMKQQEVDRCGGQHHAQAQ